MSNPKFVDTKCCALCKHFEKHSDRDGAYHICKQFDSIFVNPSWLCEDFQMSMRKYYANKEMQAKYEEA